MMNAPLSQHNRSLLESNNASARERSSAPRRIDGSEINSHFEEMSEASLDLAPLEPNTFASYS